MMRGRIRAVAQLVLASFVAGLRLAAQGAPESEVLVPIAPCRVLDTAATPAKEAGEEVARVIHVRTSRCGRIIPPFATAYSIRVTRISKTPPEKLPAGTRPIIEPSRRVAAPADGRLPFALPADAYVGVDVDGYYVARGTPVNPYITGSGSDEPASTKAGPDPATEPPIDVVHSGSAGELYLDASQHPAAGVVMTAATATPWIIARTGTSGGDSGFAIANASADIMRVRGNGAVQLAANAHFFDGRTDFFGTPGTYFGHVSVPTNVIHDVTLVNPLDESGGSTSRLTFFNAFTHDEVGSPPITKFRARTGGYYAQENVNFDSTFHWHHQSNQYHFRAGSTGENKTTFWVKAATNQDTATNTRADMYVSGRVGVGVTAPSHTLDVAGHDTNSAGSTVQISSEVGTGTSWANQVNITNARGGYGLILGFNGPGMSPLIYHFPNGAHLVNVQNGPLTLGTSNAARMTVAGNGAVGIGTTAPVHALDVSGNTTIGSGYTAATTVPANGLVVEGAVGIGTPAPMAGKKLHVEGDVWVNGAIRGTSVIGATYQDLAEWVPATTDMPPGTVVILNPEKTNEVMPSVTPYDVRVAGVVSAQPGLILGEASDAKEMIATTGRVKVKVDARRAPIAVGDLLVTSDRPGTAMKSVAVAVAGISMHRPGTIIGKALEPLASGEGEILVLLSLQ